MKKKNTIIISIFILTLAGIIISLSNYASKAEESHQAAEEIVDGEESRSRTQDKQEEEFESLLPEATDSVPVDRKSVV